MGRRKIQVEFPLFDTNLATLRTEEMAKITELFEEKQLLSDFLSQVEKKRKLTPNNK